MSSWIKQSGELLGGVPHNREGPRFIELGLIIFNPRLPFGAVLLSVPFWGLAGKPLALGNQPLADALYVDTTHFASSEALHPGPASGH